MPIYVYECEACHEREEHMQHVGDPPVEKCAKCGGKLARVIAPAAFHLKGGGWYKDGYGSSKGGGGKGD